MKTPQTFEEAYQSQPFSRLVSLGIAAGRRLARLRAQPGHDAGEHAHA